VTVKQRNVIWRKSCSENKKLDCCGRNKIFNGRC